MGKSDQKKTKKTKILTTTSALFFVILSPAAVLCGENDGEISDPKIYIFLLAMIVIVMILAVISVRKQAKLK